VTKWKIVLQFVCNWPTTSQIKNKNSDVRAFYDSGYVMAADPQFLIFHADLGTNFLKSQHILF
jgi:hypothetical protein